MAKMKNRNTGLVAEITAFDPGPSVNAAARVLDGLGAPYALIGGLALDAWGISRATKDVDLAVPTGTPEAAAALFAGVETTPLRIGGVAIRDEKKDLRIDLIDRRFHFADLFREAINEAREAKRLVKVGKREIPLVGLEYLLTMKLVSGDAKDDADVRRILSLEKLDYRGAREIVERHLGPASASRLDAMAREMGRPEAPKHYGENGGGLEQG